MADFNSIRPQLDALRSQAKKKIAFVYLSFFFFCLLYLLVLSLSAFAAYLIFTRFYMVLSGGLIGILLFATGAFISVGVCLIVLRFLFVGKGEGPKDIVEINETVHPTLMKFIFEVCDELHSPRPHKVFISATANASVTGHLGLKGYLRPHEKMLTVGYPLLRFLNKSELRAVLAHEFAHFSNDSMVPGNFLSRLHRGLHKMIYTHGHVEDWALSIYKSGGWPGMAGKLIWSVITGVRKIFASAYEFMHMRYMASSRISELMADKMAAVVGGGDSLCISLCKLDFLHALTTQLDAEIIRLIGLEKKLNRNYWSILEECISFRLKNIGLSDGIHHSEIPEEYISITDSPGRLKVADLWQAHPSFEDRKENVRNIVTQSVFDSAPAIALLENREKIEDKLTSLRFREIIATNQAAWTSDPEEEMKLIRNFQRQISHSRYKGYFDFRFLFLSDNFIPEDSGNEIAAVPVGEKEKALIARFNSFRRDNAELRDLFGLQNKGFIRFEFDGKTCGSGDIEKCRQLLLEEDKKLLMDFYTSDEAVVNWHFHFADSAAREQLKLFTDVWIKVNKLMNQVSSQMPAWEHYANLLRENKPHTNEILMQIQGQLLEFEKERTACFEPVYLLGFAKLPEPIAAQIRKLNNLRLEAPESISHGRYNLAKFISTNDYMRMLSDETYFAAIEVQIELVDQLNQIATLRSQ